MDVLALITAFGGGAFAAAIGGTNAFIFTGIFAICGSVAGMCGFGDVAGFVMGNIAFGSFFGPHIGFTGGVGAAAYAKKKGYMENGADTVTPLVKLNKPDVLIVGGIIGVVGFLLKYVIIDLAIGGVGNAHFGTDGPGFIVFWFAIVIRLMFGGKFRTGSETFSKGSALSTVIVVGLTYSLVTAGIFLAAALAAGPDIGTFYSTIGPYFNTLMFGLAAVGLLFAVMGLPYYAHHHISIITAEAAAQSLHYTQNIYASLAIGIVFGLCATLLFDLGAHLFNSGTDSHIDPPAFAIWIMTFVVTACFPGNWTL